MNNTRSLITLVCVLAMTGCLAQSNWEISDDYVIEFSGSGAEGSFAGLEGTIVFDPQDLKGSRFDVSIDPATIATGNKTKDKHARGKSWFDVENYLKISFMSDRIRSVNEGYLAEGQLTMHGVDKPALIEFSFESISEREAIFNGTLTVDRQEFGIEGPFMAFMVGDEFEVQIKVNAEKVN